MAKLKMDDRGRKVDEKGRTFLERYVMRGKFLDADYVETEKDKLRATYSAAIVEVFDGDKITEEIDHDDRQDYSAEIQARKKSRLLDRQAFAAKLAQLVNEWKPELVHAGEDKALVKKIDDTFIHFYQAIRDVREDDIVAAIETLSDLYYEMQESFEELKAEVLAYTGELEKVDSGSDAPVTLWSLDFGRRLIKELGQDFRFLDIKPCVVSVTIPKALYDAFEQGGDLMTPAQIQHEASTTAARALKRVAQMAIQIQAFRDRLTDVVNQGREDEEPWFEDDEITREWAELKLSEFIRVKIAPELNELVDHVGTLVENLARTHADRAASIHAHLHHRKRRIAMNAAPAIIGVSAATLAILLGAGMLAATPFTGGVSALGAAGLALASVALIRASASGIKLLYEETRSLRKLTKSLEKDSKSILKSYKKGMVSGKEIAGSVVNSVFVVTLVKSYPRLKDKFDLIERRMAITTRRQIDLSSDLNNLLNSIESDRDKMRMAGIGEVDVNTILKPFEEAVEGLIDKIMKINEKMAIGEDGKSFNTIFATAKGLLEQIGSMIGSKTAIATAIIPVLTEFTFLIANAAVGCAGLTEATTALTFAVNASVVIAGELGDAIGTVQSV